MDDSSWPRFSSLWLSEFSLEDGSIGFSSFTIASWNVTSSPLTWKNGVGGGKLPYLVSKLCDLAHTIVGEKTMKNQNVSENPEITTNTENPTPNNLRNTLKYGVAALASGDLDSFRQAYNKNGALSDDKESSGRIRNTIYSQSGRSDQLGSDLSRSFRSEFYSPLDSAKICIQKEIPKLIENYFNNSSCSPNYQPLKNGWKIGGPPIVTCAFSLIYIIMYVCYANSDTELRDSLLQHSQLAFIYSKNSEIWRYFTYQFLHRNIGHLLINIILLLFFGGILEFTSAGHYILFLIYNTGVVVGAMCSFLVDVDVKADLSQGKQHLIGCSAGVYCLMSSHLANLGELSIGGRTKEEGQRRKDKGETTKE